MMLGAVGNGGICGRSDDGCFCGVCYYPLGITNQFVTIIQGSFWALTCREGHVSAPGLSTYCVSAAGDL